MSRTVRLLLLVGGFIVIGILIVRSGPALLLSMMRRVGWGVGTVIMLYVLHVIVRAWALWRVIVRHRVPFSAALRVRFSGESVEVLTYTGPFLAEPAKGWLLTRLGLPSSEAFAAVATEYLLYNVTSAVLTLASVWLLGVSGLVSLRAERLAFAVAILMAAFIASFFFAAISGVGLVVPIVRSMGSLLGRARMDRAAEIIDPVERLLIAFLHDQPARLAEVLAIELAGHALMVAEIWVVLAAVGVPFLARDPLIIEGAGKLVALAFFFVPGQFGATEAVYAVLLRVVGLTASVGLTLAFVRRIRSIAVAAIGLLVLMWGRER